MALLQLVNELSAIEAHVNDVITSGTQRATEQRQCLIASGRTRPVLPYPALTDEEREQISFWLGGVYWRFRGGGFLVLGSTQSNRSFYTRRVFKELARISNASTQPSDRAADSIFCGLFDGWGSWFDMGTYMNSSRARRGQPGHVLRPRADDEPRPTTRRGLSD